MSEIPHNSTADRLLVRQILDNPIFTDVTDGGETYTTYRVIRIVHTFASHPSGWTHIAEVTPLRSRGLFEAFLDVRQKSIERSKVRGPIPPEE